ncbi:MAG: ATP-binding cassette domain-containing protein, partial [Rhizobium sp.]|nr:ATP-binding cassette domain-containing protein [Rhizobium sp.]
STASLSGGQQQRVALARALALAPEVLLLDEPLSNLDAGLRRQIREEIRGLQQSLGLTVVYVTHDQTEAMTLADRIVVFNKGRIEQVGAPMELYERPANMFVAGFIGAPAMNFLPASVENGGLTILGTAVPRSRRFAAAGPVTAGVRPEHLTILSPEEGGIRARVELIERLGAQTYAYVDAEGLSEPITLAVPDKTDIAAGDLVGIMPVGDRVHIFDSEGAVIGN